MNTPGEHALQASLGPITRRSRVAKLATLGPNESRRVRVKSLWGIEDRYTYSLVCGHSNAQCSMCVCVCVRGRNINVRFVAEMKPGLMSGSIPWQYLTMTARHAYEWSKEGGNEMASERESERSE